MAIAITSAGIQFYYAVEETAGTRPTALAEYTAIKGIKSLPTTEESRTTYDVTPLEETVQELEVDGLLGASGELEITAVGSETFYTAWKALVDAYEAGIADGGKSTWFTAVIPNLTVSCYYTGKPFAMTSQLALDTGSAVDFVVKILKTNTSAYFATPTTA